MVHSIRELLTRGTSAACGACELRKYSEMRGGVKTHIYLHGLDLHGQSFDRCASAAAISAGALLCLLRSKTSGCRCACQEQHATSDRISSGRSLFSVKARISS